MGSSIKLINQMKRKTGHDILPPIPRASLPRLISDPIQRRGLTDKVVPRVSRPPRSVQGNHRLR